MHPGYPVDQKDGLKELRLWSRDWEKGCGYIDWEPTKLGDTDGRRRREAFRTDCVRVVEHVSAKVDNGSIQEDTRPKIPALAEVLAFLPGWPVVTKAADVLVEAWIPFSPVFPVLRELFVSQYVLLLSALVYIQSR